MNRSRFSAAIGIIFVSILALSANACGDDDVQFQGGEGGDPTGGATTSTTATSTGAGGGDAEAQAARARVKSRAAIREAGRSMGAP